MAPKQLRHSGVHLGHHTSTPTLRLRWRTARSARLLAAPTAHLRPPSTATPHRPERLTAHRTRRRIQQPHLRRCTARISPTTRLTTRLADRQRCRCSPQQPTAIGTGQIRLTRHAAIFSLSADTAPARTTPRGVFRGRDTIRLASHRRSRQKTSKAGRVGRNLLCIKAATGQSRDGAQKKQNRES
jgi:hypothetical protein